MLPENPFLLRELRQHGRRPLPVLVGLLLAAATPAAGLLFLRGVSGDVPTRPIPESVVFWLIAAPHIGACIAAGYYGADRVFGEEHRRSALEALFLLPVSAPGLLLQKLCLPILGVALLWLAGGPVYLLTVIAGVAPWAALEPLLPLGLAGGLAAIPLTLLLPPDYRERIRRQRTLGAAHADPDLAVRGMTLGAVYPAALLELLYRASGWQRGLRSFFEYRVPAWLFWSTLAIVVIAASLATALATVTRREDDERRAWRARLFTSVVAQYGALGLVTGLFWGRAPVWMRILILLFPLLLLLLALRRMKGRRRDDPAAAREVAWLASRWENPLFVKDLRVYTRGLSLSRAAALAATGVAASFGFFLYLARVAGRPIPGVLDLYFSLALVAAPLILVIDASVRPWNTWVRERTGQTLPLLFLTPLSSAEILRGRLAGALVYTASALLPVLALVPLSSIYAAGRGWQPVPMLVVALAPMGLLIVVAMACAVRRQSGLFWLWCREEWLELGLGILQTVFFYAGLFLVLFGRLAEGVSSWMVALLLCGVNLAAAWACFRLRVSQLDALRRGDLEVRE